MMSLSDGSMVPARVRSSVPDTGICTKWSSAKPAYKPMKFEMPMAGQTNTEEPQRIDDLEVTQTPGEIHNMPKLNSTSPSNVGIGGQCDTVHAKRNPDRVRCGVEASSVSGVIRSPNQPPKILDVQAGSDNPRSEGPKSQTKNPPRVAPKPLGYTTLPRGWKASRSRASIPLEMVMDEKKKDADCSTLSSNKQIVWTKEDQLVTNTADMKSGAVAERRSNDSILPSSLRRSLGPAARSRHRKIERSAVIRGWPEPTNAAELPRSVLPVVRPGYIQYQKTVQPVTSEPDPQIGSCSDKQNHHRHDEQVSEMVINGFLKQVEVEVEEMKEVARQNIQDQIFATSLKSASSSSHKRITDV